MTVEEAEALAKQGNVNAMMALGDYFFKKENDDYDIDRALHYYELAANAGELQAILEMARTFRYRADVMFSFYESAGKCSSNDADIEKAGDSTVEFAENNLMVAISRLATLYYMDEKYDDIVRITRGIKHPYAQSIYGYALYKLANTAQEMKDAFNALIHKYFQRCSVKNKCGTTGAGTYTLDGNYVGCNRCSRGRLPYRTK